MSWYDEEGAKELPWYNNEDGVGSIHPRQLDNGDWEYWFVDWRYRIDTVAFILRNGKKFDEDGKEINR